ncbi:MAG: hypothetical protein KDC26_08060 [Armatimonadetes bacterium]|nr:hypothetical protein [Armatimonadota bacterium]
MRSVWVLPILAVALMGVAGCQKKPGIEGKWTGTRAMNGMSASMDFNFAAGKVNMDYRSDSFGLSISGDYELAENTLTIKNQKLNFDTSGFSAEEKKQFDLMRQSMQESQPPDQTFTVAFDGPDSATLTDSDGVTTSIKRVK